MTLIRRFSLPLTILSVLAAMIAAPYMIPENPDSAIFRNGTLGFILLLAAGYPLLQAFRRVDGRTLICGAAFGFLFACALSLGSELYVYNGLLPGLGSLVRRAAVPVLAAPLLGGLAALAMSASVSRTAHRRRIPMPVFAAVLLLCRLPVLLSYFPGMLNYDFLGEYVQYTSGEYSNLHPLLYSVIQGIVLSVGMALHSPTFGLLLMTLLQMTLFALALAYSCAFARDHGAPVSIQLLLTAFYGLHPVFSLMSVSRAKDTLFTACVLALSLLAWRLIESPDDFFSKRRRPLLFVVCTVGTALLRNNGLFALMLLLPALTLLLRRRRAVLLCAAGAGASLFVFFALNLIVQPASMPSFQLYSIPAQQLVRAYNVGNMSDEEKAELKSWYVEAPDWAPEDIAFELHPYLADSAKGYLDADKLTQDGNGLLDLWARVGKKNVRVYLEAFLMLNVGSWYPDDLTHSTIYIDAQDKDLGYLQTQLYGMEDFDTVSLLPGLTQMIERLVTRNRYQRYPILPVLFCTATPLWVLVFSCFRLAAKRRARMIVPTLGALGLWLSYLFGPCTLPRYMLPLFCLAPVVLCSALSSPHIHQGEL